LNAIENKGVVGGNVSVSQQPAQALDYIRRQRDVKFHESLLELLTRQYETARQQEAKDISVLEILDTARPAERKSWPDKRLWILLGGILGILIGILWTALEAARGVILGNPVNRARLSTLVHGTPAIPPHP
jgi:tyrosine-protein kinase Etk/Wzc